MVKPSCILPELCVVSRFPTDECDLTSLGRFLDIMIAYLNRKFELLPTESVDDNFIETLILSLG